MLFNYLALPIPPVHMPKIMAQLMKQASHSTACDSILAFILGATLVYLCYLFVRCLQIGS